MHTLTYPLCILCCFVLQVLFFSERDVLLVDSSGHRGSIKGPELEYNEFERMNEKKNHIHIIIVIILLQVHNVHGVEG